MEELVSKAKKGDKEALEELLKRRYKKLITFAKTRMKNETDAQDVVQDTMEKICKNINQLKESKHFEAWIIRILINECNKKYNEKSNKNESIEEYKDITFNSKIEDVNSKIDIINMLKVLDETDKDIMILYYYEYKIKEIADIMQMNGNTVKTRIKRAKGKIKNAYKIDKKKGEIIKIRKTLIILLAIILVTTGIVYAKDLVNYIKKIFKDPTDGVQTAIENGYIKNEEIKYIETDDFKISVDEFLIDDSFLDITFNIDVKVDDAKQVDIENIVITDENNNIIFNTTNMAIKVPEGKYYKGGYSKNSEKISSNMFKLCLKCNGEFPKSHKLFVKFESFIIFADSVEHSKDYNGEWEVTLEVPEKMHNREGIIYHVKSCSDKKMTVDDAILTNTAFKISIPETTTDKIDYDLLQIKPPKDIFDLIALGNEYVETTDGKKFDVSKRDGDKGYTVPNRRK